MLALTLALALAAAPPSLGGAYSDADPTPAAEVTPGTYAPPAGGSPVEAVRGAAGRALDALDAFGRSVVGAALALPPVRTAPAPAPVQRRVRLPERR